MSRSSEPIFNVPAVVLGFLAVFVLVQAGEAFLLSDDADVVFIYTFGFVPARYDEAFTQALPGGAGAAVWTFVTYAFLHGDFLHLAMNAVWFLPFGAAMARRFGPWRFIGFFGVTAAAGAATHLLTNASETAPMIGASAAVSGLMAGAIRFAFAQGGPLQMFQTGGDEVYRVPAVPLTEALRDRRIVIFLVTWFGLNVLFGMGTIAMPGVTQSIAWQAHIGGFIAGLILFSLFDPVRSPPLSPT